MIEVVAYRSIRVYKLSRSSIINWLYFYTENGPFDEGCLEKLLSAQATVYTASNDYGTAMSLYYKDGLYFC